MFHRSRNGEPRRQVQWTVSSNKPSVEEPTTEHERLSPIPVTADTSQVSLVDGDAGDLLLATPTPAPNRPQVIPAQQWQKSQHSAEDKPLGPAQTEDRVEETVPTNSQAEEDRKRREEQVEQESQRVEAQQVEEERRRKEAEEKVEAERREKEAAAEAEAEAKAEKEEVERRDEGKSREETALSPAVEESDKSLSESEPEEGRTGARSVQQRTTSRSIFDKYGLSGVTTSLDTAGSDKEPPKAKQLDSPHSPDSDGQESVTSPPAGEEKKPESSSSTSLNSNSAFSKYLAMAQQSRQQQQQQQSQEGGDEDSPGTMQRTTSASRFTFRRTGFQASGGPSAASRFPSSSSTAVRSTATAASGNEDTESDFFDSDADL